MVGNYHLMGYGTEKDEKKAYFIFAELVKQNFSHAFNALGYMY
jgi:TPR repeat protein